ncbi:MAG: DUF177 domain-containing protein [Gammaproteobacteria bacterium]|nr:MAG: DUF177 domain-containing protein [Gammaproteobacteria bacterium]
MKDHLPDRLDLYAAAEAGRVIKGRIPVARLARVVPLTASGAGELDVILELDRDQEGTRYLAGSIKGVLELQCQRCLDSMDYPLNVRFRLGLVQNPDDLQYLTDRYEPLIVTPEPAQISEVIADEVLLALPIAPLHADIDNCREVAADYDVSANAQRDNPFAVLKQLKQKT